MDIGDITEMDLVFGVIYVLLGWSTTYAVLGYLQGFDAYGILVASVVMGNFVAIVFAIIKSAIFD